MIETPIAILLERMSHTLEHRIAPEVEDPVVRGQVFAVVEMLAQLLGKVEYRRDLVGQDVEHAREMLAVLLEALAGAGVVVPPDVAVVAVEPDFASTVGDEALDLRRRTRAAVSTALGLLDDHRDAIADAGAIEARVFGILQQGVVRDILMFRPQRFDRISQREEEE